MRDYEIVTPTSGRASLGPLLDAIGRDGVIRKKVIGATNWNSPGNRALIAQLLAEGAR